MICFWDYAYIFRTTNVIRKKKDYHHYYDYIFCFFVFLIKHITVFGQMHGYEYIDICTAHKGNFP